MKVGDKIEGTVIRITPNVAMGMLPNVKEVAWIEIAGSTVCVPVPSVITHVSPDDAAMTLTHSSTETCDLCALEKLRENLGLN